MRIYTLNRKQVITKALDNVFPFFTKAENLALITPPSLAFRVLTPSPIAMERGRIIDYTIRMVGMEVRWRSMITAYEPPLHFVDEQIMGPYSFWHHSHTFERLGKETLMHDCVRYALPLCLAGMPRDLAHRLYVRPNLEHIFDYRRDVIASMFGCGDAPASNGAAQPETPMRELPA